MRKTLLIAFCVFGFGTVYSQTTRSDVISTSGDYYKNTSASLSWTLGECVTETLVTVNTKLTQGFQQTSYIITAFDDAAANNMKICIYPNPTTNFINIEFEDQLSNKEYTLKLFDLMGNLLLIQSINSDETQLEMSPYTNGVYFLTIIDNSSNTVQNFKIQKNH